MAVKKILVTSNLIYRRGVRGGVCRTMVLTWIRQSHLGVRMNDMANALTGGGFAQISFRHESTRFRMRLARDDENLKQAVSDDILHGFSLVRDGDPAGIETVLLGVTLENIQPDDDAKAMLTMSSESETSGHALGLAFNTGGPGGFHYMLDPNSGLYEYNTLEEMFGGLGHVTQHIMSNYCKKYRNAKLELFKRMNDPTPSTVVNRQ